MIRSCTACFEIRSEYLKKQIGLAASAHSRYNFDHSVISQRNEFIQVFFPFNTFHR